MKVVHIFHKVILRADWLVISLTPTVKQVEFLFICIHLAVHLGVPALCFHMITVVFLIRLIKDYSERKCIVFDSQHAFQFAGIKHLSTILMLSSPSPEPSILVESENCCQTSPEMQKMLSCWTFSFWKYSCDQAWNSWLGTFCINFTMFPRVSLDFILILICVPDIAWLGRFGFRV